MKSNKRPVVVDLFCGAGGESQGIHWATEKANLDIEMFAVNHWQTAIDTHTMNFPGDECICKDIADVNPTSVIKGGKVALLWASPACTHFSTARGGKPMDEQSRVTPFTVLDWLDKLIVDRVIIENVPEFQTWGPLDDTQRPVKELKGTTYEAFIAMIISLGFDVDSKVLNAADFGAPTTRRRLFIQAVRKSSGKKILWPEQTHFNPLDTLFSGINQWVPARDIIDWSIPCPLIDDRKRPLAPNTMKRIMQGIEKYWGEGAKPFITRYNGGENRNHDINEPMPVLDTSNRYGLVEPLFIPQHSCGTVKPVSNPLSTIATAGAISIIEPLIMEYYGNGVCKPVSVPIGVVTTKERFAMIEAGNVGIGFRMLQPHELAAAQSFPSDYQFTGNKGDIVKQIGNAVCPKIAEAIIGGLL